MKKIIRLGMRRPVSTFGKFLITKSADGNHEFWDTENARSICPPNVDKVPWCQIEILEDFVILTAFPQRLPISKVKPTSGYERGIKCLFIKARGQFLMNPYGCYEWDCIFDKIIVSKGIIYGKVTLKDNVTTESWFDSKGNWLAVKQYKKEDEFYTIKLKNGEEINRVCEVLEVKDTHTLAITGINIIYIARDADEVNLFYPF